jgi:hypothetical protein
VENGSGIEKYQTKTHEGIVQSTLAQDGKCITVNDGLIFNIS